MRIDRFLRRTAALLLCFALCLSCICATVFAYSWIQTEQDTSLTIQYPCEGTMFQLYRVADVSQYGEYSLAGAFADYSVSLEQADQTGWRTLASTLSGYAARDKIAPVQTGRTDTQGSLTFSALPVGMYLVVSEKSEKNDEYYVSAPFLIALPDLNADDQWVYDVSAEPKYVREPVIHPIDLKVIKVWKDGESATRPAQIEVQLLRNDTVWDTVVLSEQNSWRHTWTGLDDRYTWQITEKAVPAGYTVSVQPDGNAITITNTKPGNPQKPPRLPQTGVLWWPVGVLAAAGILMLLFGFLRRKGKHE